MKGFSAYLEMKRCKDWDHEISSWKYLTIERPVAPDSLEHRVCECPPESPSGAAEGLVGSYSSTGFSLFKGRWQRPLLSAS